MTQHTQVRAGPPFGRHVAAVALTVALTLGFFRLGGSSLPLSHAVVADVSLVLLCVILALGAGARLIPRLRPFVPWGRELGIAMFVTAGLHTAMFLGPELDVVGWFEDSFSDGQNSGQRLWVGAQWLGVAALAYAAVLAATSNDWSQRMLGRGWKFVQRQAYTLFVLAWLHTAAFLYLGAGHEPILPTGLFPAVTGAAVAAQLAGFSHTVVARRVRSEHRVPPRKSVGSPGGVSRPMRWIGVAAMWATLVSAVWLLSTIEATEEPSAISRMCDRYEELGRPVLSQQIREELEQILDPSGDQSGAIFETLELCDR